MKSLAWWPHTSDVRIASARLRCFQVVSELQRQGVQASIYKSARKPPDVLVLSKRYDEKSIRHAVKLREQFGTRLVLDLCDNHFYASNDAAQWKARAGFLRAAVAAVDMVVASTPTLAQFIREECGGQKQVLVVGDAVEAPHHPSMSHKARSTWAELQLMRLRSNLAQTTIAEGRRLVWFGNHGSGNADGGMRDLILIREILERASREAPLTLTVISNNANTYRQVTQKWAVNTHYLEWACTTFSRALELHDIALIPVGQNPFTLCKTNNRVATAFVHGLAVIADSIPSYEEFSGSAVLDDWNQGIDLLMSDHVARAVRIERGAELVRQRWNLPHIANQWAQALDAGQDNANHIE